jgi:AraC family ethanolamine operon transcriptional activator
MLERNCAVVLLSMRDIAPVVFNGREVAQSVLKFAHGPVEYRVVEKAPGYFAALVFAPEAGNRGWPETNGGFLDIPVSRDVELALRRTIDRLFTTASQSPDLTTVPHAGAGMADSLAQMLDLAFEGHAAVTSSTREAGHDGLRAVRAIDELIDSGSSDPLYSGDIAAKLGISVRSLTNLMARSNGMSLHRYIRMRRLWTVRRQLLIGDPRLQIKEVALANGFWHLGDFAAKYYSQFGELPSSTQAQIQSGRSPSRSEARTAAAEYDIRFRQNDPAAPIINDR